MNGWFSRVCGVVGLLLCVLPGALAAQTTAKSEKDLWKALQWRSIGPYRGGRSVAVAGVASQPKTYYFGATGGGVWKTTDGGVNWANVSDGFFGTGTVGALAVAQNNPNVIYAGMGETPIRGNVSHGDGMYKSIDAGKTWKHIGLAETRHIGRIVLHPNDANVAYVAALGQIFGTNEQRGVFRTKDGGKTWEKVLYRNDKAGAVDIALDPANPNVLFASIWEVKRTPYSMESGGPGSGIFKTTDGGDNWTEISGNPGLPAKRPLGISGVSVSPINSDRVWAIVEAEDGGVFRSDNGGETWVKTSEDRNLRQRAWYYSEIYADPGNIDGVYVLNVSFHRSLDGGRTFSTIPVQHGDTHDLWIAPNDPKRMILGDDGGAEVTTDGGLNWTEEDQPTAQFYRVTTDNDFPYNIYGAQQDNSTVGIRSRSDGFGITERDWDDVGGGESGWIAPYPKDSNIVFAGSYGGYLTRYNRKTGQSRNINVWPDNPMGDGASAMKYRFQWNFPIVFSPHDPDTLYTAGNLVFKTTNQGQSWTPISPDLTRDDKAKQGPSGGPITKDNTSVEYYCTIFTMMESPVQKGVIWTGSDDGLVHVTRDGGAKWDNVTPPKSMMPEWIQINSLDASPFDAGTAYVAATMYKSNDFKPYLYVTRDFGKTWTKITNGLPDNSFTRVVRADPNRKGLLYAGTETGLWVSFDDGANWQSLQLNLPVVPITDLAVHKREGDLIAATQGRSFWVLDDLNVVYQMADAKAAKDALLFKVDPSYRGGGFGGFQLPSTATIGANPASGTSVYYWLKDKPKGGVTLEFLDAAGKTIKKFSSEDRAPGPKPAVELGLNRFVWNQRYPDAANFPGMILWAGSVTGPRAAPGNYQVKLTVNGQTYTENFAILKDPRSETTQEGFVKQFEFLMKVRDKLDETHKAILSIRDSRAQIEGVMSRARDNKAIADAGAALVKRMTEIEEALYQTKNRSGQDPLNYPIRLNNKLAGVGSVVGGSDDPPTDQAVAVYNDLAGKIDVHLNALKQLMANDLAAFNKLVRDANVPAVSVKTQ
jgi:photosystem II stability/assembly factor-like uncharacterized protein